MDYTNPNDSGGSSYESAPKKPKRKPGRFLKLLWLVPVAVLVLALALDSFYTLKEDQYAVITTFGKPSMVSASGLQFKLPFVQKCTKVSKTIQGFRSATARAAARRLRTSRS